MRAYSFAALPLSYAGQLLRGFAALLAESLWLSVEQFQRLEATPPLLQQARKPVHYVES